MLLEGKSAVVYGGGGAMGGAAARAFAREGATVYLAGRTQAKLDAVAGAIDEAGGSVGAATELDAHDPEAVEAHADRVAKDAGSIDVHLNAVGLNALQMVPLVEMSPEEFARPVHEAARTHFLTATAAAKRMREQGSGAILLLSSTAARECGPEMGGFSLACAAVEALARGLAGEVGRHGVRVVALRPNFTPETTFDAGEEHPEGVRALADGTALGRLPRLLEVADTAAFLASDGAGALTATVVNLSCGGIVD